MMAKSTKKKIVSTATTPVKKKAKRYSSKEKTDLLSKYAKLRNDGVTAQNAAAKLKIPYITLRSWEKKAGKGKTPAQRSAHTELKKAFGSTTTKRNSVASLQNTGLTLVTPTGYRIERITTTDIIKVLKSL
jgi:hypothetical protein